MRDLTSDFEDIVQKWCNSENENYTYCAEKLNELVEIELKKLIMSENTTPICGNCVRYNDCEKLVEVLYAPCKIYSRKN